MSDRQTYLAGALEQIEHAARQLSWTVEDLVEQWHADGGIIDGDAMVDLMSHKKFLDGWLNRHDRARVMSDDEFQRERDTL